MHLFRVSAPYMTAGVQCDASGTIRTTAPILAWTRGKHIRVLQCWCKCKRFGFKYLGE